MTALEGVLRRALSLYDPPQPPGRVQPRQLGPREGKLPGWLKEPHGPDEIVFGPRLDPHAAFRDAIPYLYGEVTCGCGAGWDGQAGSACWACGGKGRLD